MNRRDMLKASAAVILFPTVGLSKTRDWKQDVFGFRIDQLEPQDVLTFGKLYDGKMSRINVTRKNWDADRLAVEFIDGEIIPGIPMSTCEYHRNKYNVDAKRLVEHSYKPDAWSCNYVFSIAVNKFGWRSFATHKLPRAMTFYKEIRNEILKY